MEKIKIHSEVEAIRRHFQQLMLERLLQKLKHLHWPHENRNAATYSAEDAGFGLAKKLMEEIVMGELHFTGADNGS